MAAFAVLSFASPEGAYAAMVRLESLPCEEQPLQDADVVSWELGQEKPAHHALNTRRRVVERRFLEVGLRSRLPRARPAGPALATLVAARRAALPTARWLWGLPRKPVPARR
jgi:hypothetical protein